MKVAKNMTSLFASLVATKSAVTAFSISARSSVSSTTASASTTFGNNRLRVVSPALFRQSSSTSSSMSAAADADADADTKPYKSDNNYDYDMVVIGGGSGGVRASRIASGYGAKVLLLETQNQHGIAPYYSAIGGTCVNVGCVPKKLMVFASRYPSVSAESIGYGWDSPSSGSFNWDKFMDAKNTEITRLNNVYGKFVLEPAGVETCIGLGTYVI
jgi:hypothetical protein